MAEGHYGAPRNSWSWLKLFSTFQVALDPKKLLLAAMGLVCMAICTWFLSLVFFSMRSEPKQANYDVAAYQKADSNLSAEQARKMAEADYQRDLDRYKFIYGLAGPGDPNAAEEWKHPTGVLRVMPWNEYRGPNPLTLARSATETGGFSRLRSWFTNVGLSVLIEPLVKFVKPVSLLLSSKADFGTRVYLLLVAFVVLAVWAFFGGAISRIAVLQLAGKDAPGLGETLRYICGKYMHYVAAPMVPVLFVAGIVVISILFSFLHLIPFVGDLVDGVLWPIPLLLGFAQALLLVGLVGYPLMFATISAEGSDTFDALSRSYNYVYQSPWHYAWNCAVAVAYGMVVVFFVVMMGSLVVYLTKWSMGQNPATEYFTSRRVDHLFIFAPDTFGFSDLLVDRPELKSTATKEVRDAYLKENLYGVNYISSFLVSLWTSIVVLFVVGFSYSYFFTSSAMVYLLMREKVDDTEIDEVFTEDSFADEPLLPPMPQPAPTAPQVQMVDAPTLRTPENKPADPPAPAAG
jgi:hypothetical protein